MSLDQEEFKIFYNYINNELSELKDSPNCCKTFTSALTPELRTVVHKLAKDRGCLSRVHYRDTIPFVTVYKKQCATFADLNLGRITLNDSLRIMIQEFLNKNPLTESDQMKMSPNFYCPNDPKPTVKKIEFIEKFDEIDTKINFDFTKSIPKPVDLYRNKIIETITMNRVSCFRSRSRFGKSRRIPEFIMHTYNEYNIGCKIVSTQLYDICAYNNWQMLTTELNQMFVSPDINPQLVGCQTHSTINSASSTRITYTTTKFFLRSLMGTEGINLLRKLTHIIIDDIQENDAFTLMLANEIREIFYLIPSFKVILLSSNELQTPTKLIEMLGNFPVVDLEANFYGNVVEFMGMEEIVNMIGVTLHLPNPSYMELMQPLIDELLYSYYTDGVDEPFNRFLYLVDGENVGINVKHSKLYITALMGTVKNDNFIHLMELVKRNVNCILSEDLLNKLHAECIITGHLKCYQYLMSLQEHNEEIHSRLINYRNNGIKRHKIGIDYDILTKLLIYILKQRNGNIIVFLPSYEDLLKLKYRVLKEEILCSFGYEIEVHLLHPNVSYFELQSMYNNTENRVKIIIATEIAEAIFGIRNITTVIDTGRKWQEFNIPNSTEKDIRLEWISKEKVNMRQMLVANQPKGYYYYFFTHNEYNKFECYEQTIVDRMNLDTVALYGKILRPFMSTSDYLKELSSNIPPQNIQNTIETLTAMDIFDNIEDITWLGIHLIEIPLKLSSAKMLIYAIFLQCLDPILTVAGFLEHHNVLDIPHEKTSIGDENRILMKNRIMASSEGYYSDHFVYINMFNNWKKTIGLKQCTQGNNCYPLIDESNFVINEIMKSVEKLRLDILLSNSLINFVSSKDKAKGTLNQNACQFSVIKACITSGLYPNISQIDPVRNIVKSRNHPLAVINPSSVIRDLNLSTFRNQSKTYPSKWVAYNRVRSAGHILQINTCTLITPLTMGLFCGPLQLNENNVVKATTSEFKNKFPHSFGCTILFIDTWIELILNETDANLIMLLRRYFNHYVLKGLRNFALLIFGTGYTKKLQECVNVILKLLNADEMINGFKTIPIEYVHTVFPYVWLKPINENAQQIPEFFSKKISNPTSDPVNPGHRKLSFYVLVTPYRNTAEQLFATQGSISHLFPDLQKNLIEAFGSEPYQDIFIFTYSVQESIFSSASKIVRYRNKIISLECFRNNVDWSHFAYLCGKHRTSLNISDSQFKLCPMLDPALGYDLLKKMANTEYCHFK